MRREELGVERAEGGELVGVGKVEMRGKGRGSGERMRMRSSTREMG